MQRLSLIEMEENLKGNKYSVRVQKCSSVQNSVLATPHNYFQIQVWIHHFCH